MVACGMSRRTDRGAAPSHQHSRFGPHGARSQGARAEGHGEACPHHFTLTEELTRGYNTHARKMNPPLRTSGCPGDQDGLRDGTIDVIATDHAPHATQEKQQEFTEAPFGIVGWKRPAAHAGPG